MVSTIQKQNGKSRCSIYHRADIECPTCKKNGVTISATTLKSQLKKELLENIHTPMDEFNFCTNPQCDTVYYSNNGHEFFTQKEIKSKVTVKNSAPATPLCYCKKLLKKTVLEMIENQETDIAEKIRSVISTGKSFCEKSNPKGGCCTEDIKNFLAEYGIEWEKPDKVKFSLQKPTACC